jgi:hypothetical protein
MCIFCTDFSSERSHSALNDQTQTFPQSRENAVAVQCTDSGCSSHLAMLPIERRCFFVAEPSVGKLKGELHTRREENIIDGNRSEFLCAIMKQRYGKRVRAAVSSIDDDEKVAALAIWLLRAELKRAGRQAGRGKQQQPEQKEKRGAHTRGKENRRAAESLHPLNSCLCARRTRSFLRQIEMSHLIHTKED